MRGNNADDRFGSSNWARGHHLASAGLFDQHQTSIFVGYFKGRRVYFHGPAGMTITAGARAGKMRDVIARNLLSGTCQHSIIFLDLKGEGAYISQDQTRDGKYLGFWNPAGLHGLPQDRINFLAHMHIDSPTLVSDVKVFWENLIAPGNNFGSSYFKDRAREFGEALSLAICECGEELSFPRLYEAINLIPGGGDRWQDFAFHMSKSRFPNVRSIEEEIAEGRGQSGDGFRGILGELFRATACLSDPILMASVSPPYTLAMQDIVTGEQPWQFYLMPPAEFVQSWSPVIKSAFVSAMLLKSRAPTARRITFFLDECGQLGGENGFPLVPRLFTYGAGIGIQPVAVFQSNGQMKGLGPGAKELIQSSSAATLMFAMRGDVESCQDCVARLGTQTLKYDDTLAQQRAAHQRNQALQSLIQGGDPLQAAFTMAQSGFEETHQTKQGRPLRTMDEAMNMPSDRAYFFHEDVPFPIELERSPYWQSRDLAGLYHPNPYHPPIDRVNVQTRWGQRMRRVITEPVPDYYAHLPQYRCGTWSYVEM
ncbi:type IV secretory system conjugative DNA transfer family protein [Roseobacter sp. MH60115]|uniref:type IV secretory system conjugative DNA transfer family protein n=1 Tax=Roseobacter sp. MH60115 TaxID=2785324 RepID=UPI0018A33832|nr:type IV secretory system conjugative DNA transfer family protein [Roseobacter sp. MH60115]